LRAATGERRSVSWTGGLLFDNDDPEAPYIFLIGRDVTDIRRAEEIQRQEERLRMELAQEREISAMRSRIMTTVSHEFRTPLATILTSSELLERHFDTLTENARVKRIKRIKNQIEVLTEMLDEISTVIRTGEGQISFSPERTDIGLLCQTILQDVRLSMRSEHDLRFINQIEDNQPLMADTRLLKHIIANLLTNAMKYSSDDARIDLIAQRRNSYLIIQVKDQGIGIPESDRENLFKAFYRGSNIENQSGTGLGLKIVHDCVMIYNGTISYETDHTGTTFTVTLPIPNAPPRHPHEP
jgi:signal transduction histidine kinase